MDWTFEAVNNLLSARLQTDLASWSMDPVGDPPGRMKLPREGSLARRSSVIRSTSCVSDGSILGTRWDPGSSVAASPPATKSKRCKSRSDLFRALSFDPAMMTPSRLFSSSIVP